ncbi:MAG: nitroreductase family protein [Bacillota bacterium]|nr:nitroreductase family protein [Bacillota bacterium]
MDDVKDVFLQVINDRRSIRNYTDEKVSDEDLNTILESARQAPSGENAQPWRFIVVRDEKNKKFLSDLSRRGSGRRFTGEFLSKQMHARFEKLKDQAKKEAAFKKLTSGDVSAFVNESDVIVIVLGKKEVWDTPFDTSAAIENMLLAVTALGLGACWLVAPCIDVRDEKVLNEYFGISDEYKTVSIIAIGQPARVPKARPRLPIEELVFSEKFGESYFDKK